MKNSSTLNSPFSGAIKDQQDIVMGANQCHVNDRTFKLIQMWAWTEIMPSAMGYGCIRTLIPRNDICYALDTVKNFYRKRVQCDSG